MTRRVSIALVLMFLSTAILGAATAPSSAPSLFGVTMNKKYRVAIIGRTGHGDYGHDLDQAWRDVPDAQVVAVADDDKDGEIWVAVSIQPIPGHGEARPAGDMLSSRKRAKYEARTIG